MKVHYETIEKALRRVIKSADERNRRIEYIELTAWEMAELREICNPLAATGPLPLKYFSYNGIPVYIEGEGPR